MVILCISEDTVRMVTYPIQTVQLCICQGTVTMVMHSYTERTTMYQSGNCDHGYALLYREYIFISVRGLLPWLRTLYREYTCVLVSECLPWLRTLYTESTPVYLSGHCYHGYALLYRAENCVSVRAPLPWLRTPIQRVHLCISQCTLIMVTHSI